jgi:1-aminocyclopropane-1-carboxylate deaminase
MKLLMPSAHVPIVEISMGRNCRLFIKREDLIHPEISGNKYWKLFYNVNEYLSESPVNPAIATFGGAYSNHIYAVSALGKEFKIKTFGIIRGEELAENFIENPTLSQAARNGMSFRFVSRADYREKEKIVENLKEDFPEALIIPEGGTNHSAVEGIKFMLNDETSEFDYLCCAVGTGGTLAGISKFAESKQRVLGLKVVRDDSLENIIYELSGKRNFELLDAGEKGYGKFSDETTRFINNFYTKSRIPLEPIYTGKALKKLFELIQNDHFPAKSKILFFHTGGLQGIAGANEKLRRQKKDSINVSE